MVNPSSKPEHLDSSNALEQPQIGSPADYPKEDKLLDNASLEDFEKIFSDLKVENSTDRNLFESKHFDILDEKPQPVNPDNDSKKDRVLGDSALKGFKSERIVIDAEKFGSLLSGMIMEGARSLSEKMSGIKRLTLEDIKICRKFSCGLCIILEVQENRRITPIQRDLEHPNPSLTELKRSLYVVYFLMMTRGTTDTKNIPKFIRDFSNNVDLKTHARRVSSFEINRLQPGWLKKVDTSSLTAETRRQLSLYMPGYRYFNCIAKNRPTRDLDPKIMAVYDAVTKFVKRGPVWDIHNLTRPPHITAHFGNLNHNLINLLYLAHTEDKIRELKNTHQIYENVAPDSNFVYKSWDYEKFSALNDFIFEADRIAFENENAQ